MRLNEIAKVYRVEFSTPGSYQVSQPDGGMKTYPCKRNHVAFVAAMDLQRAAMLIQHEFPEAVLHQVLHQGGTQEKMVFVSDELI